MTTTFDHDIRDVDLCNTAEAIDCTAVNHWLDTDTVLERLLQAVFDIAKEGGDIDIEPILRALDFPPELDAAKRKALEELGPVDSARSAIERTIDAGDALCVIGEFALWQHPEVVEAARGALAWERWTAYHEDDLSGPVLAGAIGKVARHIGRRSSALIDAPLRAEDIAWAVIEGARQAGLPIAREAWRASLDGAWRGICQAEGDE